jgi:integrase/recombinase XerD
MSSFPCLVRFVSGSGQVRYRLGDRLADRYLEFVAGRCRPNTLRAVAFDLKTFFTVIGKGPVQVTAADVFDFLADQRGDRTVVRLADGESGLSARTIARRLSSVSGLYAYLVARGDTPVQAKPGAARPADAAAGRVAAGADRAAGAGAADAAADLVAAGGRPAGRGAAYAPGPGDGAGDAAGRAAPV